MNKKFVYQVGSNKIVIHTDIVNCPQKDYTLLFL